MQGVRAPQPSRTNGPSSYSRFLGTHSNVFGLDRLEVALCGPQGTALTGECPTLVSDHGRGGTPGPIPNPEVKPPSADGTAG